MSNRVRSVKVLILRPDNTKSRVFSKWKGPAVIVEVESPQQCYVVDLDGVKYRMHANQLRHYHARTDAVTFDNRVFDDVDKSNSVVVVTNGGGQICPDPTL